MANGAKPPFFDVARFVIKQMLVLNVCRLVRFLEFP